MYKDNFYYCFYGLFKYCEVIMYVGEGDLNQKFNFGIDLFSYVFGVFEDNFMVLKISDLGEWLIFRIMIFLNWFFQFLILKVINLIFVFGLVLFCLFFVCCNFFYNQFFVNLFSLYKGES